MKKVGVVAFAFGVPYDIKSNRLIAEIASKKARDFHAPVYTQADIQVESGINVEYTIEKLGDPPPTLRIARGSVSWAQQYQIGTLYVVAAKPHLWRCMRDLRYSVSELRAQIEIQASEEIGQYHESEWYCSDSVQLRTRSRREWRKRERILELTPICIYRRVAS